MKTVWNTHCSVRTGVHRMRNILYVPYLLAQFALVASADTAETRDGIIGLSLAYLIVTGLIVWHLLGLAKRLNRVQVAIGMMHDSESE